MEELSDLELLHRLQSGDEDALVTLHRRYAGLVFSVACRVLNDGPLAEEVTQDTFLRLWHKADAFDPDRGSFVVWLLTIARHLAIDTLRKHQLPSSFRTHLFPDRQAPGWEDIRLTDGNLALRQTLVQLLRHLPQKQRQALELAYFGGMTYREVAAYLEVPTSTIKGRMRLAIEKLRAAWFEEPAVDTDTVPIPCPCEQAELSASPDGF